MNDNSKSSAQAQYAKMLNSGPQIDLMEYWLKVWRRKWILLAIMFVFTLGASIYAILFVKPIYEVGASISIESNTLLDTSLGGLTGRSRDFDYQLRR